MIKILVAEDEEKSRAPLSHVCAASWGMKR